MRRLVLAAAAGLLLSPAYAGKLDQCSQPYGPVLPAAPVTKEQLKAAKAEVVQFIEDSDAFQSCLIHLMDEKDKDDALTPAEKAQAQRKIDSNQREKQAIGDAYNALAKDYASRNPNG